MKFKSGHKVIEKSTGQKFTLDPNGNFPSMKEGEISVMDSYGLLFFKMEDDLELDVQYYRTKNLKKIIGRQ